MLAAIPLDLYPLLERFGLLDKLARENVFEHTRCAIASIDEPDGRTAHPHATEEADRTKT